MHWLVETAVLAGIPGLESSPLPDAASTSDAWEAIKQRAGLTPHQIAGRLAAVLHLEAADLTCADPAALIAVSEKLARRHHVVPLRYDDRTVTVATSDPNDLDAEQDIGFLTGRRVIFELAPPGEIAETINAALSAEARIEMLLSSVQEVEAETVRIIEESSPEAVTLRDVEAAPIVRLTNLVLADAVNSRASDIHIESAGPRGGVVRFRIDGVMRQYLALPPGAVTRVVSRIKVLGQLDIADRTRPQDGRARIQVGAGAYDLRISTVPTHDAEKAVIRILQPDALPSLDAMELSVQGHARFRQLLACRDGIVIVTGPTGSGKTTTLYAAVKEIATGELNVMTVEDPVEYALAGITQIQVEVKKRVTFATALRSILRQDPDVILLGEIRDAETATIAVQAATTGHLVLATLHTNDSMSAIARLADLGLDRAAIAATVRGVLAQRLVRRPCELCAQAVTDELTADEARLANQYGVRPVIRPIGCRRCANTGYHGRIPVDEVAVITPSLAHAIDSGDSALQLQRMAVAQGMCTMRSTAIDRVLAGMTTLEEMHRVLGEVAEDSVGLAGAADPRVAVEQLPIPPDDTEVAATLVGHERRFTDGRRHGNRRL
jgi:type II secretory ATPase GspE/PulE/Tfp pilus assembly ATPase PilB-like protein